MNSMTGSSHEEMQQRLTRGELKSDTWQSIDAAILLQVCGVVKIYIYASNLVPDEEARRRDSYLVSCAMRLKNLPRRHISHPSLNGEFMK